MEIATAIQVSPVNMEDRRAIGVRAGDTVRVHQKIEDKGKTRIQVFEGLVLARKHGDEPGATFTVRKVVDGIGVEKIFPLYSPMIDKIEIVRRSKVRRAKLYYIREKVAREIKRQMRRMQMMNVATESGIEAAARAEAEEAKKAEEAAAAEAKKAEEEVKAAEEQKEVEEKAAENTESEAPAEEPKEESAPEKTEDASEEKETEKKE